MSSSQPNANACCVRSAHLLPVLPWRGRRTILFRCRDAAGWLFSVVSSHHGWRGLWWYNRGVGLQAESRHSEALATYDRSLDHLPRRSDTWHNRGMVLGELGRHGDALQSYDKALEIRPDDPDTWNFRGGSLSALGRLHDAIASYDRSLALRPNPNHAAVIDNRAIALDNLRLQR